MHQPILHVLNGQHLWLTSNRSLYWQDEKTLILSDLHFGKTGHFRKNAIAVPQSVYKEDFQRLINDISFHKPQKIIVVGDLFHSHVNQEMDLFLKWRNDFIHIEFHLVKGNHDILKDEWYKAANIHLHDALIINQFQFVHDLNNSNKITETQNTNYLFSGHIHPGIQLKGIAKQSLRFPCFYFGPTYAILPAFSRFTGLSPLKTTKKDIVYAIVNESVIKL